MDAVLVSERSTDEVFATVAMVRRRPVGRPAAATLAGRAPAAGAPRRHDGRARSRSGTPASPSASSTVTPGTPVDRPVARRGTLAAAVHRRPDRGLRRPGRRADGSGEAGAVRSCSAEPAGARPGPATSCWTTCWPRCASSTAASSPTTSRSCSSSWAEPGVTRKHPAAPAGADLRGAGSPDRRPGGRGGDRCRCGCTTRSRPGRQAVHDLRGSRRDLNAALLDQETGFRGYALTGDETLPRALRRTGRAAPSGSARPRLRQAETDYPDLTQQPGRHGQAIAVLAAARWPTRAIAKVHAPGSRRDDADARRRQGDRSTRPGGRRGLPRRDRASGAQTGRRAPAATSTCCSASLGVGACCCCSCRPGSPGLALRRWVTQPLEQLGARGRPGRGRAT